MIVKIKQNGKTYEYDRKMIWLDVDTHKKLKMSASCEGVTIRQLLRNMTETL